ncbi:putative bifunctional diguanylate cyclase/phosphodiesterase [Aliiglaciecola sp. M165]|uniref:putative bifunctional diguanylate cyclase/phosphodiesterase n=1 Tax=Aliiglaciecola sp. M165 TaxID=2593649 RepID=UPI0011809144|nr:bifunctional diguanylate cyclase/phosphodiesterase [Aliiglaciecola sp. M165]TRY29325.1 bifunctional diguanylate cyclase/phosphodiesterase [Aliiglaciecola sp. M165]
MGEFHQSLTTIPNRYAFLDRIDESVKSDNKLSLMLIDVVRFSDVSSSLGYQVGDIILLAIANRIKKLFGEEVLLGRISGDIFGLVIPGRHGERQLRYHFDHLVEHFKTPITFDGHAFIADFNVGAVANSQDNSDTIKLLARAEAALKQAKENKYENLQILSMLEKAQTGRSLALKADLKRAFQNDEMEIYFQPKVELETLKIIGAECLLRWNHPLDGVLFPGALIEAAESYNMMNELGYWTLEQAFKSAVNFKRQGLDLVLSVNMSPTQLYDFKFIPNLQALQEKYEINLNHLELELTEDVALSNSLMVKRQLSEARALGMKISVDDFGKGYSNLAYIRDLAIDTIKIDKTFVMGLEGNPVNLAIIQAAQVIGEALNCDIVAEGIETIGQMHMLREVGIESGQGFLFSQAIPELDFIGLCRSDLAVGTSKAFLSRQA